MTDMEAAFTDSSMLLWMATKSVQSIDCSRVARLASRLLFWSSRNQTDRETEDRERNSWWLGTFQGQQLNKRAKGSKENVEFTWQVCRGHYKRGQRSQVGLSDWSLWSKASSIWLWWPPSSSPLQIPCRITIWHASSGRFFTFKWQHFGDHLKKLIGGKGLEGQMSWLRWFKARRAIGKVCSAISNLQPSCNTFLSHV